MRALVLWLAVIGMVAAAPPPPKAVPLDVSGDTVLVVKSFPCLITAAPGAGFYAWNVPPGVTYKESFNVLTVTNAPKGSYKITVKAVSGKVADDKVTVIFTYDTGETTLVIGELPVPPGPTPPVPPVPPAPVGPMRVLIVYETADLPKLTKEQRNVIYDPKVRGALKDRTDKSGPDGRGYNIWDKDTDATGADKFWQDGLKRSRPSTPYIHIWKNDVMAFEGPLPATTEETLNLINKYAGG